MTISRSLTYGIVLNIISLMIYFYVVCLMGFPGVLDKTLLIDVDSQEYLEVGNWLFGVSDTQATAIRPFLYPALLKLSSSISFPYGIWFLQWIFWTATINLVFFSCRAMVNNTVFSFLAAVLVSINVSLISFTLYALAEITATLLLSVYGFVLLKYYRAYATQRVFLIIVLISSLLTVVKPVYSLLLWCVLILYPLSPVKKYFAGKWYILLFIAVLSPVFTQLAIMKIKHNTVGISCVGEINIKVYYFPAVYAQAHHIDFPAAREAVKNCSRADDVLSFVLTHKKLCAVEYVRIIISNIDTSSPYVDYPGAHTFLPYYVRVTNRVYFYLHLIMFLPVVICCIRSFVNFRPESVMYLGLASPVYLLIFTSGICFMDGDRIIIPMLPLSVMLYGFTFFKIAQWSRKNEAI